MRHLRLWHLAMLGLLRGVAAPAGAMQVPRTSADTARLTGVRVEVPRDSVTRQNTLLRATMPATAGATAGRVAETVNVLDAEDAAKYLPSIFIRKRNNGDTQAVLGSRVWGVNSSARSLVYADGVPLSALIANNNSIGGPRWGLVAPSEVARVDIMYGPFSAAYPGNSMGAVLELTTRAPTHFGGMLSQTYAAQTFLLYGTKATFGTAQTAAAVGGTAGRLGFWASGNFMRSHSQPLSYVTTFAVPVGTTGGYPELNKVGAAIEVLGASGMQDARMANGKVKLTYAFDSSVTVGYTLGVWGNDVRAEAATYLQKDGAPTYNTLSGFAQGTFTLRQRHSMQALTVRATSHQDWHWEGVATRYRFDRDVQRLPGYALFTGIGFGTPGRVPVLTGTGWVTGDVKGMWHRGGLGARHVVSFGVHIDAYRLVNPTYNTSDWQHGAYGREVPVTGGAFGVVSVEGDGRTQSTALWVQDAWRMRPSVRLTVGGRFERWHAFDGVNVAGLVRVEQPEARLARFSPKGVLVWEATPTLTATASMARAYRFATVAELYQLVQTGATWASPNPDLRPDNVLATEVRLDRRFRWGQLQGVAFLDNVHDAMLSQFVPLAAGSTTPVAVVSNVDHIRAGGVELSVAERGIGVDRLDLAGSVTWLEARIITISGAASASAPPGAAANKFLPNIPRWRATAVATFRASPRGSISVAGRYSDMLFTTLDNADVHPNTYGGFAPWFVADAKAQWLVVRGLTASLGVDNLLNRKYFVFNPFPQRTFVASIEYAF